MTRSPEIRVGVIGAGSWGTTVASLAAVNTPTTLWARRSELVEQIKAARENADYLAGFTLPDSIARHRVDRPTPSATPTCS